MANVENKYYQVGVDSQAGTSGRGFKMGFALGFVLVGASCLALFSIMAQPASQPIAESTDLAALLSSMRAPGVMRPSMLPGSSPFKKLAVAAIEANNLARQGRDVSMMAGKLENVFSNMDAKSKSMMVRAEEAATLKAKDMPGVTAPMGFFDPLGFSADCEAGRLLFFREVEIKHGRVGMLASLGFLVAEQFHPLFGGDINVPSYISFQQTPLQQFWFIVATVMFVPELASINSFQPQENPDDGIFMMKTDRVPGDFGFDPLGLKPKDPKAFLEMQNKEINNGRLAMLAAAGMIAQELVTGKKLF